MGSSGVSLRGRGSGGGWRNGSRKTREEASHSLQGRGGRGLDQEAAVVELKGGQSQKGEWTGSANGGTEDNVREPGKPEGWNCLLLRWENGKIN